MFIKHVNFFLYRLKYFVIKKGSEGPFAADVLGSSKIAKKVLQYVREPKLATWE